jgi:mono/diheme cytochrome c family protein
VRTVLETNCVHCHGDNRLSTMPPINDTQALSKLIGTSWIVPGKPEASRFFQVVTFPDEIPGAMPPSGHAISKKEVQILREWIKSGAKLPAHNIKLKPQGPLPRSV